jgi:hypothetical protein
VAYAEKRGKGRQPWRVKYKLPDGTETSESAFETKAAALAWGSSSGRTAATTGAATTAAGCSGPHATGGTCRLPALPAAWSSPSRPPPGPARQLLPGPQPPRSRRLTPNTSSRADTASRPSLRTSHSHAGYRSSSA